VAKMTGETSQRALEARQPAEQRGYEDRYRTLFDYAPDGIVITDPQSYYLDVNPSFCRMLGMTRAELVGMHASDIVAPEEIEHIAPALDRIHAREDYARPWLLRRKDGSTFPVEVMARLMPDGKLMAVVRDVTERKAAERALREREAQLELASKVAKLGAWTVDVSNEVTWWSNEVRAMRGLAPDEELTRKRAIECYAPEYRELITAKARACALEGIPFDVEVQVLTGAKSRAWERVIGQAERDAEGRIVRVYGTVQDIDEQRTLYDQMQQAQKMEAIGQLAGGVAHDFNNMLSVILGYAELAQQKMAPDAPGRAELLEIERAAQRSAELTRDLLAFSRKQLMQPRAIDVSQVVVHMENLLRRLLGEDVELLLDIDARTPTVLVDPKQVEQVLMNLAVNARDAMPHGGKLHIEVSSFDVDAAFAQRERELRPGRYVTLAVTDSGMGMDAATRERVFEPFFTTKELGKGTGLGLSTVFGIVKQCRGHVTVYSELGHGSTFRVYLPSVDAPAEALTTASLPPGALIGNETILLVEDEQQVREVTAEILLGCGYNVLVAADAVEAIELARRHHGLIHLLLTDVVMARMSGRELAERLAPLRPSMRVMYVSGYTHGAIVHQGVLQPGIAFLQKPMTRRTLCEKVREVLGAAISA
jgi:two-component system, cell cycle sensor histidine kinase and response regulator CckA